MTPPPHRPQLPTTPTAPTSSPPLHSTPQVLKLKLRSIVKDVVAEALHAGGQILDPLHVLAIIDNHLGIG